jgi:hypothetical protein
MRRSGGVLLSVLGLLGAQTPAVGARPNPPSFALQVSPTRLVVPAGAISTIQRFQVSNKGRSPFVLTVEKANFVADRHGALKFEPDAPYAAASWASFAPRHFQVQPGKTREVTLKIDMPESPEPGDHQLALIFKVPAGQNSANIKINRGVATPVYITVPGPVDSSVRLAALRAPGFVLGGPVPITAKIQDVGTVHRDFRGDGRLRVQVGGSALRFPDLTVLRASTREVTASWNPPLMCLCHATVSLPGSGAGTRTATVRIIVFPLHLLAAGLAGLALAVLLTLLVRRRYRDRVLAAARQLMNEGFHR